MIQQLALDSATALQQQSFRNHARFSNSAIQQLRFSNRRGSTTALQQLPRRFSNCSSATAAVQQLRFSNCRGSATALQQLPRFRNWPSGSTTALEQVPNDAHGPVRFEIWDQSIHVQNLVTPMVYCDVGTEQPCPTPITNDVHGLGRCGNRASMSQT